MSYYFNYRRYYCCYYYYYYYYEWTTNYLYCNPVCIGKGVIQTLQEVRGGGGVAVTIAKYETPLHNNINKIGIAVDVATPECSDATPAEVCLADVL